MKTHARNLFLISCIFLILQVSMQPLMAKASEHPFNLPEPMETDIFDRLRQNCVNYLTSGSQYAHNDYNPQDLKIKFALQDLNKQVKDLWETMFPSSEIIWNGYQNNLNHAETSGVLKNLTVLSLGLNQYGSSFYKNENLKNDLLKAMEWMYQYRYSPKLAEIGTGDWYYKEIQCGLGLGYNLMLLGEYFTDEQREKWLATYHAYNPNGYDFTEPWGATTAANRIDKCLVTIMAAINARDGKLLKYGIDGLDVEFTYAKGLYTGAVKFGIYDPNTLHDGFYPDGSFLQHVGVAHTGGYGTALLEDLPFLFNIFAGTEYQFPDSYANIVCNWIKDSYIPVVFRGGVMDFVKDREIARRNLQTHKMGQRIASAICGLVDQMPEGDNNFIKSVVKGWISKNDFLDFFSYMHEENQRMTVGSTIRMQKLIDDSSVEAITDFTMGRMFAVAARAVQFRPGYAFNVGMNSSRNKFYEAIRNEGKSHWYINEGMTCFYSDKDLAHYDEGYWATVNLYRLPGTTVDTKERTDNEGNNRYGSDWSGGVQLDDKYVAMGYQLSAFGVSLKAKKSYFMLEGKIACLGADINSTDNRTIETTIENRKYKDECIINEGKNWLHYAAQSQGGYYFPKNMNLKSIREKRVDNWGRLGGGSSRTNEENDFFTLWIDHGKNPNNAEYQYVFLPNATLTETQKYALRPDVMILENSSSAQGVTDTKVGVTGINFWTNEKYTVKGHDFEVSCDKKASFIMIEDENGLRIAVSDPTWKNDGEIRFEIIFKTNKKVGKIISKDEGITVLESGKKIIFTVKTQAHLTEGKTFMLSFNINN